MLVEVAVHRSRAQVRNALFQFVARRGLSHQKGWWSDDQVQIEYAPADGGETRALKIGVSRRRGVTVAQIDADSDQDSIDLAYSLRLYLESDAAYESELPVSCPNCAAFVRRARANFCATCGTALSAEGRERMAVNALKDEPDDDERTGPTMRLRPPA